MDFIEQLWTLKQIYQNENAYYDPSRKQHLHHIPSNIPAEKLDILKQTGRMPNQILYPRHDEIWDAFYTLADTWTLSEAADAFIAGLWSAPFLWQSALNAKLLSLATPRHAFTPYQGSSHTCTICGFQEKAVDSTLQWYRRMTDGVPWTVIPRNMYWRCAKWTAQAQGPPPQHMTCGLSAPF